MAIFRLSISVSTMSILEFFNYVYNMVIVCFKAYYILISLLFKSDCSINLTLKVRWYRLSIFLPTRSKRQRCKLSIAYMIIISSLHFCCVGLNFYTYSQKLFRYTLVMILIGSWFVS